MRTTKVAGALFGVVVTTMFAAPMASAHTTTGVKSAEYDYYSTYANREICEKAGKRYVDYLWRDYYCKWTGGGTFHNLYVLWNG